MNTRQSIATRDCSGLVWDNIGYLQQGAALLQGLEDTAYAHGPADLSASGVGPHLRHCLDHYDRLFAGLVDGRIDYDARDRDRRLETDREFAITRIRDATIELQGLAGKPLDLRVAIKMDSGGAGVEAAWWSVSSLGRELQFLISHTVHHFALMALLLRRQGIEPGPEFGVAPSTLRHQAMLASCAR